MSTDADRRGIYVRLALVAAAWGGTFIAGRADHPPLLRGAAGGEPATRMNRCD